MNDLLTKDSVLRLLRENLDAMKSDFKVRRIGLFGSVLKENPDSDSDIDLLVEFEQNTFDGYMNLKHRLENLLGREVDLVLSDSLKPRLRPLILNEVVYVEGA